MPTAFITGITGQDGYYLSEFLLGKGYMIHGVVRRTSSMQRLRLDRLLDTHSEYRDRVSLHYGDVTDAAGMIRLVLQCQPDEVYNLAAQSHVRVSFDKPAYTQAVNAGGTVNMLAAVRLLAEKRPVRFFQASTSEMFGGLPGTAPQSEATPFHPRSPYATSKVSAFYHTVNDREAYGLFACNGILFNHESPMRGENFVTRKITLAAARINRGLANELKLGNLDAQRDWGYAGDYVQSMWLMLQHETPDDYVIASGETHTVRDFLNRAFSEVNLDWQDHVVIDDRFLRPTEVEILQGDAKKARRVLGWEPHTSFEELVRLMVTSDLEIAADEVRRATP